MTAASSSPPTVRLATTSTRRIAPPRVRRRRHGAPAATLGSPPMDVGELFDGPLRTGRRVRRTPSSTASRADAARHRPGARGEPDRLARVAPDPGPGQPHHRAPRRGEQVWVERAVGRAVRARPRPGQHRLRPHARGGRSRSARRAPTPCVGYYDAVAGPHVGVPRHAEPDDLDRDRRPPLGPAGDARRAPRQDRRRLDPARRPGRLRPRAARPSVTRTGRVAARRSRRPAGRRRRRPSGDDRRSRPPPAPPRSTVDDVRAHRGRRSDRAGCGGRRRRSPRVLARRRRSPRAFDLAAVHRLLHGGWRADPGVVVGALARPRSGHDPRLRAAGPVRPGPAAAELDEPIGPDGHLRPEWSAGEWSASPARRARWAALALDVAARQQRRRRRPAATARRRRRRPGPSRRPRCCASSWPPTACRSTATAAEAAHRRHRRSPPAHRPPRPTRSATARDADGPAPRPGRRRDRPAQPGPGAVAAAPRRRRGARHPGVAARAAAATPTRSSRPCWRGGKVERTATTYGYGWLDEHVGATAGCAARGRAATARPGG